MADIVKKTMMTLCNKAMINIVCTMLKKFWRCKYKKNIPYQVHNLFCFFCCLEILINKLFTITTNGGYCIEKNDDTLQQSNDQHNVHNVEEYLEMKMQEEEDTIPGI